VLNRVVDVAEEDEEDEEEDGDSESVRFSCNSGGAMLEPDRLRGVEGIGDGDHGAVDCAAAVVAPGSNGDCCCCCCCSCCCC